MMHLQSKLKGFAWFGLSLGITIVFARGLPGMISHVPWSWESWIADRMGAFEDARVCRNARANLILQKIVNRLCSGEFPLSVDVIKGKEINAFATLGGKIHVLQGLLNEAQTPDELAGVLAHEIEHVHHRDIIEGSFHRILSTGLTQILFSGPSPSMDPRMAGLFLSLRFSRIQESRADEAGLKRLRAAQVSTAGFAKFFDRLASESFVPDLVSDHPASSDRAAMARSVETKDALPVLDEAEWQTLKKICDQD